MIFAKAVMQNGRLDFSPAVQTLLNPENAHMIGNSLLLGVLVVLLSTLIAAPLAYLFSRTKFARYRVFDILFMIPFMTPPYIASMGWILFMQKKGLFRELVTASLIAPPNTLVVSTFIVREFEQGSVSVGMAMAVLCVLFSTTALLILNTVIDHRKVH